MKRGSFGVALILSLLMYTVAVPAQVPSNALLRVFQIRVGKALGTAFTIEYEQKQYLVTARHVVAGALPNGKEVEIFHGGAWRRVAVEILLPKDPKTDIAVLKLSAALSPAFALEPSSGHAIFGQEVYFLGFPRGIYTTAGADAIPFIKRGTLSARDPKYPGGIVWYIDGFNNPGFSGGPVVFQDQNDKKTWKVAAVIMGYLNDTARQQVGQLQVDTNILTNSGIIVAFDIQYAVDAIKASLPSKR